jgi:5'-nucleotidase
MRILISNDDGYQAPGIEILAESIGRIAQHIDVVAPERNRSAASSSLTVHDPLRVYRAQNGFLYVNGTPSDCVHLAVTGLFEELPDMVISGINAGPNLGDDVIYSGTVAAAIEGRFLGYPAIAVSMSSFTPNHFASGARAACELVSRIKESALPRESILNVNVPDLPWEEIKGWKVTRLGNRHRAEGVVQGHDPRNEPIYWIGPAGAEQDAGPGTDFHAISNGYISITPLKVDLTRYEHLESLTEWIGEL